VRGTILGLMGLMLVGAGQQTASRAAVTISHQVDTAENVSGLPENTLYGSPVTWSLNVDPAATNWIAWNDRPSTYPIGGKEYVGMGDSWIGIDDYFILTVQNPVGDTKSVIMDYNYFLANSVGTQAILFGQADAAPDVHRFYYGSGYNLRAPWTGDPSNPIPGLQWDGVVGESWHHTYFDEDGAFNDLFTVSGRYDFSMTYGNSGNVMANHPDMYILADGAVTVPEPSTLILLGMGAVGVFFGAWRRRGAFRQGKP